MLVVFRVLLMSKELDCDHGSDVCWEDYFDINATFNHVVQIFFYLNHELENCYIKFIIFKVLC